MMLAEKKIVIRNQSFILTNQRAMFWEESSALIFSDLHLGKTAHFRKNGIALPDNLIQNDLNFLRVKTKMYEIMVSPGLFA